MIKLYRNLLLLGAVSAFTGCEVGDESSEDGSALPGAFGENEDIGDGDLRGVVNGKLVKPGGYPAVAFIDGCTGTVISPNVILTAAHCLATPKLPDRIKMGTSVSFGNNRAEFAKRSDAGNVWKVTGRRAHPTMDIAVVSIDRPAPAEPVKMRSASSKRGDLLTLVGFGITKTADRKMNKSGTKRVGNNVFVDVAFNDGFIVVGKEGKGVQACHGDSGAPLFDSAGRVAAVVSSGTADLCKDGLSFGTQVRAVRGFIDKFVTEKAKELKKL